MLSPVLNKDKERAPSRLEKAAQLFGMTTGLANATANIGGFFNKNPTDEYLKQLAMLRTGPRK